VGQAGEQQETSEASSEEHKMKMNQIWHTINHMGETLKHDVSTYLASIERRNPDAEVVVVIVHDTDARAERLAPADGEQGAGEW